MGQVSSAVRRIILYLISVQSTPRALAEAVSKHSADPVSVHALELSKRSHKPRHRVGCNSYRFSSYSHSPVFPTSPRYSALVPSLIRISGTRLPRRIRRNV